MTSIIAFEEKYAADFKRLNMEWLQQFFVAEPYDEYQLSHPQQEIIDKGGYIFLAKQYDLIVGTVALMRENGKSFELTKMSVTNNFRGQGISKLLMDACINTARKNNWERLFLYSNTILAPAIQLYRRYGFKQISLEQHSHYTRTNIKMELNFHSIATDQIKVVEYTDSNQPEFKALNLEWLDKYGLTESHDLAVLNDPREMILNKGGYIWLAMHEDKVVGSAALVKEHEGEYELAKMAVAGQYRGKGISKVLIETCVARAKQLNAERITLFSNHQLKTALKLYEKYGFSYVPLEDSPFATADIKMELLL